MEKNELEEIIRQHIIEESIKREADLMKITPDKEIKHSDLFPKRRYIQIFEVPQLPISIETV